MSLKSVASKLFQHQSSSVIAAWVGIGLLCAQLLFLAIFSRWLNSFYISLALIPVSSLAGAGLAYICSWIFFRKPFDSLIDALRASRDTNGKIPALVKGQNSADMNVVVDEFNTLIEEQKKASRQVKVCLLYTSPSPRDGLLSRMPSSA